MPMNIITAGLGAQVGLKVMDRVGPKKRRKCKRRK